MKHETITLVDEAGIEILVAYNIEYCKGNTEECHGYHTIGAGYVVDLESVEVVIAGTGIDILKSLTLKQIRAIEDEVLEVAA